MHNTSQESSSNCPIILMSESTKSASCEEVDENSTSPCTIDINRGCFEQVKQEVIQNDDRSQNLSEEKNLVIGIIEERGQKTLTDQEIKNLNELVIESENSSNLIKTVTKKRGRPKGVRNDSICMKSKTTLHNKKAHKEEEKKRVKKLSHSELSKKNTGNVTNKFKGAKEMRVQVLKLTTSLRSDNPGDKIEKCLKSRPINKTLTSRKNATKISPESSSGSPKKRKQLTPIETELEIKKEPESSEEDNFDNDPDYFPIKDEPGLSTPGRKKSRIGRPPKIGSHPCKKCETVFSTKRHLQLHQKVHSIPKQSCRFCDFEAKSVVVMMEHEAKHTNEKPFKCDHPECDYASKSNVDLQRHKSKHSTEKKYKCPYENCDFVTKWQRNIRHHVLRHTDERPHPCHLCPQSFKRIQDLKYHLYRHNDDKPIACDECDFKCKTNFELKCHKLKHSDVRNYACTYPGCTQRTKSKSDLTKHMKIHSDKKDYICDECGKGFRTRACLSKHLQRHSEDRPFSCYICNRAFKVKVALRKHVALHSEYRPFSCEMCGQKFSSKSNKNVHMKTHDYSDRPFPCPVCPYAAKIQSHLLSHIGSMHGNSYAYFCEICKKPFKRYGQLKVHHVRMHPEVDFGKLKSENAVYKKKMKDGIIVDYALDEDTLASVEECINSVITESKRSVEESEGKDFSLILNEVNQSEDSNSKPDFSTVNKETNKYTGASEVEKRKRGRPKKLKPCIEIQNLEVKQEDMKIQSDAEKLQENLVLSEKLIISAENQDVKDNIVLGNLNGDVSLTPVTPSELTKELQTEYCPQQNKDTIKSPATLTIYKGGFRLPLATKGFKFNFDKTGKKPKSWFMNPDNMHKGAREHQMKYLARKDTEYKYYLRAQRKKMMGRNKVLESLERRRKSAAKRFATTKSTPIKRRHGKEPFRFTKVVEEGHSSIGRKRQKQTLSEPSSLVDSIPCQTLPKLIFKKNPDQQEEYQCYQKEDRKMDISLQSQMNDHEENVYVEEKNDGIILPATSVNTKEKPKESCFQSNIRVCFKKKKGRPKTKTVKKPVDMNDLKKLPNKKISVLKYPKSKITKTPVQTKDLANVSDSQKVFQVKKKRGRPPKQNIQEIDTLNTSKTSQENLITTSNKVGRNSKKAKVVRTASTCNYVAGKGRRARKQKGNAFIFIFFSLN